MEIKNKRITNLYFNRKIKGSDAMKRINQINVNIYWLVSRRYCSFLSLQWRHKFYRTIQFISVRGNFLAAKVQN
jgi:hypothetical protein